MLGNFNLKRLFIEFVIPNLGQIYFCTPEIFEFVISHFDFTKVIYSQKAGVKCS